MFVDLPDVHHGWFKTATEKHWTRGCIINTYRIINMHGLRSILCTSSIAKRRRLWNWYKVNTSIFFQQFNYWLCKNVFVITQ